MLTTETMQTSTEPDEKEWRELEREQLAARRDDLRDCRPTFRNVPHRDSYGAREYPLQPMAFAQLSRVTSAERKQLARRPIAVTLYAAPDIEAEAARILAAKKQSADHMASRPLFGYSRRELAKLRAFTLDDARKQATKDAAGLMQQRAKVVEQADTLSFLLS